MEGLLVETLTAADIFRHKIAERLQLMLGCLGVPSTPLGPMVSLAAE
jgi:hypothetical protein